jgi:hypothetical protein
MLPRDLDGFFHGSEDYVTMVSVLRQVRLNKVTERQGIGGQRLAVGGWEETKRASLGL